MTDERLMRLVAGRIQQLRKARKLTQEDMQDYGFSYRYYQRIEAGQQNLTLRVLNRLSRVLKVPIRDFFEFD